MESQTVIQAVTPAVTYSVNSSVSFFSQIPFTEIVAVLTSVGVVALAVANWFDRKRTATIAHLNTIIEGLRLSLEAAEKRKAEYYAENEINKNAAKMAQEIANAHEKELQKLKDIETLRCWRIAKSHPKPRSPLCPTCLAKGDHVPMQQKSINGDNYLRCTDPSCKSILVIDEDESEELFELLGTRGCYQSSTAKPPRQRKQYDYWR